LVRNLHLFRGWLYSVCSDGKITSPEAVVTPVNVDATMRSSSICVAAASDSTLPDELPSSLVAVVASDESNTAVTTAKSGLPANDTDVVTESAVVDVSTLATSAGSFITSSSYAGVTQSYLPCGSVHADADMVTASDCMLHSVPDEDDEEMAADEQIEDWDHEVFDP